MSKNIYVGNLPWSATEQDVENLFATYGQVANVKLISDRETGRARVVGFVEMEPLFRGSTLTVVKPS